MMIFELGYFAAKLGRSKVCLLRQGDVELLSDLLVIYIDIDAAGAWKLELAKNIEGSWPGY